MIFKLSKYYQDKVRDFAINRVGLSEELYRKRGESRKSKMIDDIIVGGLGEIAAYKYLKSIGFNVNKPDFEIYEGRKKSFSADLVGNGIHFHVKSQGRESAEKYGMSWLCQKRDRLLSNPKDCDYMIFTKVDGLEVEIKAIVKVMDLVEHSLIGVPKVQWYANTKVALYLDDILESDINLWRFK